MMHQQHPVFGLRELALAMMVLAVTACNAKGTAMTTAELTDFGTRYTAAWNSQNPASVAAFFAKDGSLTINDGAPSVGPDAITADAQSFMTALPDLSLTMDSVTVDGGKVIYRWTLDGTNTGPGGTGHSVHISGYEEWTMNRDGLIARSMGHFDAADYQRQLNGQP